jgi:hypothetical protein
MTHRIIKGKQSKSWQQYAQEGNPMNRRFEGVSDKRLLFVLSGSVILMLAVLAAQWVRTAALGTDIERQFAPAQADSVSELEEEAALSGGASGWSGDLLERELKDAWRAQVTIQGYPVTAAGDLLETDLKDAWRVQMAAEGGQSMAPMQDSSAPGWDLLERDLKEAWRAQLLAADED